MACWKTDYNAKITETERKIPSISGFATTAALNAVENKTPNVSNPVTKTDYYTKMSDIEKKYFTSRQIITISYAWYTLCKDKRKKISW